MRVAWAAGLFTGEGCVGIATTKSKNGNYNYLLLQVGMYDERAISRFANIFGINYGLIYLPDRDRNFYKCMPRGRTAEKILAQMWPFLKGTDKGDQALVVANRLGLVNWITGKNTGERPQLQNIKRGRKTK